MILGGSIFSLLPVSSLASKEGTLRAYNPLTANREQVGLLPLQKITHSGRVSPEREI